MFCNDLKQYFWEAIGEDTKSKLWASCHQGLTVLDLWNNFLTEGQSAHLVRLAVLLGDASNALPLLDAIEITRYEYSHISTY